MADEITASVTRDRRTLLLRAAQSLCHDFARASPTSTLILHFASSPNAKTEAFEHGDPSHAPFLGRSFVGQAGIQDYFDMLQQYLAFEDMRFSDYVVDEVESVVCVRGEARFTWKETGNGWDEVFTYRLLLVEEGGEWRVSRYEVWADTGSL